MAFSVWETVKNHKRPRRELESLSTQSSMSCAISRRSSFCSIVSSFGTNFADTQIRSQNGTYQSPPRLPVLGQWYDGPAWEKSAFGWWHFHSASWGPTVTWFAVHRCAAIFEAVVPLFYLCDTHGIFPESLLNLPNSFHLGIAKLLAKFDAIPLLKSFRHFAIIDNLTSLHNTWHNHRQTAGDWRFL